MNNSRFITFEGGEGAGKSTQAAALIRRLTAVNKTNLMTREPGGSDFAERVRAFILDPALPSHSPLAEALLFSAARADHLATVIRPALADNIWVVCDRFADSTRAYQGAAGGLDDTTISMLETIVVADTVPDLTLILDLPVDLAFQRVTDRTQAHNKECQTMPDPYESRQREFHERLRQGFLDIAAAAPERCAVIDATASRETVAADIWQVVTARLIPEED